MGNATVTEPRQGFEDPKLTQVFAAQNFSNKTIPVPVLPKNDHSQPVGAIAGGIGGGFVLVLLVATFLLRRRQRIAAAASELPATSTGPHEIQGSGLHELRPQDSLELPSTPIDPNGSIPENR